MSDNISAPLSPIVFTSYSHDSPAHRERVLSLSNRLRDEGVDVVIDRYEESPTEGWPRWMANQIERADFVLIVCTEQYELRFAGRGKKGIGRGGKWEGAIITQQLYEQELQNKKFVPVIFSLDDLKYIPTILRGATFYNLGDENEYERLYRRLTGQPATPKPQLGLIRPMLAQEVKQDSLAPNELEGEFRVASTELLQWQRELPGGEWLDRPELQALITRIADVEPTTTILLGAPGSGKSALLSQLASRLPAAIDPAPAVLAIKADSIPAFVENDEELRQFLGLSINVVSAVEQLTRSRSVVLIIDQLDALAYHVDLRTRRLNLLLNLIGRLAGRPNVHIVASSRAFEFEHDLRLRHIVASSIFLELPAPSDVSALLLSQGIDTSRWPEDARELLRSPQALRTFLELLEAGGAPEVFSTYPAMLDRLWTERVLTGPTAKQKVALASELASTMAEEETLWLAAARFDEQHATLEDLESAGILVRGRNGAAVGFSHQMVFEHALARNFARLPGGLSNYVLRRQSSLFVRPKLRAALAYMRAVEPHAYEREFNQIWQAANLRYHLQQLLAEFLGQQDEPSDREELLLVPVLLDRSSPVRALSVNAIVGSRGWFRRLHRSAIGQIMREAEPPISIIGVLTSAWNFSQEEVFELLKDNWSGHPQKDFLTWAVLDSCRRWDISVLDLATTILKRTPIDSFRVEHLAENILTDNPFAAFSLIRACFDYALARMENKQKNQKRPRYPENGTQEEQIAWYFKHDTERPFARFLENESHHYDLPKMARSNPVEFLDALWPWYLRVFRRSAREGTASDVGYPGDSLVSMTGGSRGHRPPLADAVLEGVRALATTSSTHFLKWVSENKTVELLSVQRLIALGFLANIGCYANEVVEFLLSDRRRMMLGDYQNRFGTTKALISAIAGLVPSPKLRALEAAVMAFESSPPLSKKEPAKNRRARLKSIRSSRLRILRAFPPGTLSDKARRLVDEEERALHTPDWDSRSTGMHMVGSPMSASAMEKARDADILKILDEVPDKAEWDHPRDFMRGGNIQLSREFAQFAALSPDRAACIIRKLRPDEHERAAGYAIAAIAGFKFDNQTANGTEARPELAFDLLRVLEKKRFASIEFRDSIAHAMAGLAGRKISVPEDIVAILVAWLALPPLQASSQFDDKPDQHLAKRLKRSPKGTSDESNKFSHSILWDQRTVSLPAGNYLVLEALTLIFLTRSPAEVERWLIMLSAHLEREEDPAIWQALLRYLEHLVNAPRARAIKFIARLFRKYPKLLETEEATMLIARTQSWIGDSRLRSWIKRLGSRTNPVESQASGELLGLVHILRPEEPWFAEAAKEISSSEDSRTLGRRVGLAFAAANLWGDPAHSVPAIELLRQLIPNADAKIARATLDAFRTTHELRPDEPTRILLQCLVDHPNVFGLAGSSFVVERLATLLPHQAELVGRLALGIAEQWKDSLGDIRTSIAATTPELVNLALTLHGLDGHAKELGTTLFERLIQLQAYGANEALQEIDRPLMSSARSVSPRLRPARSSARQEK
jgi:SEFIR domain/ATPase family associated with various cellular activities (AAA)